MQKASIKNVWAETAANRAIVVKAMSQNADLIARCRANIQESWALLRELPEHGPQTGQRPAAAE